MKYISNSLKLELFAVPIRLNVVPGGMCIVPDAADDCFYGLNFVPPGVVYCSLSRTLGIAPQALLLRLEICGCSGLLVIGSVGF